MTTPQDPSPPAAQRRSVAARPRRPGLVSDLWHVMKTSKKWWLAPILIAVGILALFVFLGGSSVAPFIYSIF